LKITLKYNYENLIHFLRSNLLKVIQILSDVDIRRQSHYLACVMIHMHVICKESNETRV
jgi:hypothetical protein